MNAHSPPCKSRGFTLIELLVVIGIIAMLIGLLFPLIRKVRLAAYGASTQSQLSAIATAIEAYHGDFGSYPGPLANTQVGYIYYLSLPTAPLPPEIPDPLNPTTNVLPLMMYNGSSSVSFPGSKQTQHITGAENLVLGLLGGLQVRLQGGTYVFEYNPGIIFSDAFATSPLVPNQTAVPQGAMSLNYAKPKRWASYLQVSAGNISHPNPFSASNGAFTDDAGRYSTDSVIPEFVDQYPDAMPILYLRSNPGGTAIAGYGGCDAVNGNPLVDNVTSQPVVPQWDLAQIYGYVHPSAAMTSAIGTTANNAQRNHHGLQALGTDNPMTDTIMGTQSPATGWWKSPGSNALAYFKDPANPGTSNTHAGNARQKDGYILITAGPDRCYGTSDDIIYPGSLQP